MTALEGSALRPEVSLPQGRVVGIQEHNTYPGVVESFKGIPYAQPPVGDLRFRPPAKVGTSSAKIDASQFGPRAPARQFVVVGPELEESEDCLTVNVFRKPQNGESQLLPVAIYFHGGAFNRGNAAMHDTASMVGWSEAPFIGVSFGYRIGALGFLPSKLSMEEDVLNLGLQDQICLMEWIRDNIEFFGGNKNAVTLFGLSAGAHSIGHHMLNYEEGKPALFHRVVMESGAPTSRAVRYPDSEIHEKQFGDFLEAVGCPKDLPDPDIFGFLRSLPISTISKAQDTVFQRYNPGLCWAFQPVIDGKIIRRRPIDAWRDGKWHKVPIVTGFTTNEGSLYVNKNMATSAEFTDFWRNLLPQLSGDDLAEINRLYPDPTKSPDSIYREDRTELGVGEMYKRIEAAYAHYAYVAPVRQTAHFAGAHVPVYLYHWGLRGDRLDGARHGDNMWYETRDPKKCAKSESLDNLSGTLHAYLTSFICTGNPSELGGSFHQRPAWAKHDVEDPKVMLFGGKIDLVSGVEGLPAELVHDDWAAKETSFWWSKVEISQQ